ncbi:hypothetical protein GQ600_8111 [Phytophthora cactorum]|nr:hypothetical protein GQ600_8111 [Phytophthora cactorum]
MGASEASLDENAPSSFDMGAGIMPFDEEYARWLQHLYETDLGTYCYCYSKGSWLIALLTLMALVNADTPGNNYDDEVRTYILVLFGTLSALS